MTQPSKALSSPSPDLSQPCRAFPGHNPQGTELFPGLQGDPQLPQHLSSDTLPSVRILLSPQPPQLLIYSPTQAGANNSPGTSQPEPSPRALHPGLRALLQCCIASTAGEELFNFTQKRSSFCSGGREWLPADGISCSSQAPRAALGVLQRGLHRQECPRGQELSPWSRSWQRDAWLCRYL